MAEFIYLFLDRYVLYQLLNILSAGSLMNLWMAYIPFESPNFKESQVIIGSCQWACSNAFQIAIIVITAMLGVVSLLEHIIRAICSCY